MRVSYCNKQGTCTASSNSTSAVWPIYSLGDAPNTPHTERRNFMNRNPKEKLARIEIRVKPKDKEKIKQIAGKCNLSVSEYVVQRALGYTPKAVQPDAFFDFHNKLCELLNRELSPETEAAALQLFDDIYAEILDTPKQSRKKIVQKVITGSPQSLLCGEKEHPRSGKPFGTCDESEKQSVM